MKAVASFQLLCPYYMTHWLRFVRPTQAELGWGTPQSTQAD